MRRNISNEMRVLEKEVSTLNQEVSTKQKSLAEKKRSLELLRREFAAEGITISDHALMRYLERVMGFNLSVFTNEIISEDLKKQVGFVGGSGKFPLGNHQIIMKDFSIITII